uniref:Uncharacterized protein n=1 Tax=Mycena chlorophos TaxID=658473 RepID=A0ABQ0LZ42_MYCCL|nr:predicted protein [Mycena chlorophos]
MSPLEVSAPTGRPRPNCPKARTVSRRLDMNPFGEGWMQHGQYASTSSGSSSTLYGFLPGQQYGYVQPAPTAVSAVSAPELIRYTFVPTSAEGSIHNSIVTSSNARRSKDGQIKPAFRITTNSLAHGYSVVQSGSYENVAYVEWLARGSPMVDIYGIVSKRSGAAWLPLSSQKNFRRMSARQRSFRWIPDEHHINLCSDSTTPHFLGRVVQTPQGTAVDLTPAALEMGLLEVTIVATLVLLSGRNIE